MAQENDTGSSDAPQSHARPVKVAMQQGEHTGQPLYSNLTSVQAGHGVVIVDFGFLDPQTMNALNHMIKSGSKVPSTIDAKMSCRIAISIDAASQLAQQLNQLLGKKAATDQTQTTQKNMTDHVQEKNSSIAPPEEKDDSAESNQGGFRFPWSKK
ncbi:MAG: hypothetical protein Q7T35_02580 [Nitrosomonas sp.]|nr:hypothetical protein [Nitrosomonas sp.]